MTKQFIELLTEKSSLLSSDYKINKKRYNNEIGLSKNL